MALTTPSSRTKLVAAAVAVSAPVLFLLALPWLRNQPDAVVLLFAGVAALACLSGSFVLAMAKDRQMDEWHRSAARFSSHWGWLVGGGLVSLLMALPPFQSLIVSIVRAVTESAQADEKVILMGFMAGLMAVIFMQMLATLALSVFWRRWMSRPGA